MAGMYSYAGDYAGDSFLGTNVFDRTANATSAMPYFVGIPSSRLAPYNVTAEEDPNSPDSGMGGSREGSLICSAMFQPSELSDEFRVYDDQTPAPGKTRGRKKKGGRASGEDKNSLKYRIKLDRQKISSKKSREKRKQRNEETKRRLNELEGERPGLKEKVASLTHEINVLMSRYHQEINSLTPS